MSGPSPVDHVVSAPLPGGVSFAAQASNLAKNPTLALVPRAAAKKKEQDANIAKAQMQRDIEQKEIKEARRANPNKIAPKAAAAPAAAAPVAAAATAAAPAEAAVESKEAEPEVFESIHIDRPTPGKPKGRAIGYAIVKSVISGDSLVLVSSLTAADATEKMVTISGINAPKFARGKNQEDEPYAWESREFLRKLTIGQQVHFNINYVHESSGREYGIITQGATNLAHAIVRNGWAKVKGPATKDGKLPPEREELAALQGQAESAGLGLWAGDDAQHVRKINWTPDARALYDKYKGVPIPGVVDQVRDGSTLRVELLGVGKKDVEHTVITLYLAGPLCPRTPLPQSVLAAQHAAALEKDPKAKQEQQPQPEPFALEAQQFTENRLLNRDITVVLQGIDKFGNLFGTAQFAKGDIALKLIELGLAKLLPWAANLTPNADKFKAAAQQAQNNKLKLWANYSPSENANQDEVVEISGKVIQVVSGDSVVVLDAKNVERKLSLASVRAPKLANRKQTKDEPYAAEAKEHLRKNLIGHKVRIVQEYVREAGEESKDKSVRQYATLFQGKLNVNESLVSQGLAEAIRHRIDEPRSTFYDDYLTAELAAKKAFKGIHNPKEMVVQRVTDLTERSRIPAAEVDATGKQTRASTDAAEAASSKAKSLSQKAKQYFALLQPQKQINAIVEHVFSGGRLKLFLPKDHVLIAFALAAIKVPSSSSKSGNADDAEVAAAAAAHVRSRILQHNVRIDIDSIDKGDNFLGSLFYGKINLGIELLELGFAQLFTYSAERSQYKDELFAAEKKAKDARIGVWKNYVEPTPEEKKAAEDGATGDAVEVKELKEGQDLVNVKVTEIEDCTDFFVHFVGDKGLDFVESALKTWSEGVSDETPEEVYYPAAGTVCAGKFTDGNWYRVRVIAETSENCYRVFFIDYGNFDELDWERLRVLPNEIGRVPALAHHCTLAGLIAPRGEDYVENAALAFSELVWAQQLVAKVELVDRNGTLHVTVNSASSPDSVNVQLLRQGWAKVARRSQPKISKLLAPLVDAEAEAKRNHNGVFEYGDVSDDEGDERTPGPDPKRKPRYD